MAVDEKHSLCFPSSSVSLCEDTLPSNCFIRSIQWWAGHDWLHWAALWWELECGLSTGYFYKWEKKSHSQLFTKCTNISSLLMTESWAGFYSLSSLCLKLCLLAGCLCRPGEWAQAIKSITVYLCLTVHPEKQNPKPFGLCTAKCLNPGEQAWAGSLDRALFLFSHYWPLWCVTSATFAGNSEIIS